MPFDLPVGSWMVSLLIRGQSLLVKPLSICNCWSLLTVKAPSLFPHILQGIWSHWQVVYNWRRSSSNRSRTLDFVAPERSESWYLWMGLSRCGPIRNPEIVRLIRNHEKFFDVFGGLARSNLYSLGVGLIGQVGVRNITGKMCKAFVWGVLKYRFRDEVG